MPQNTHAEHIFKILLRKKWPIALFYKAPPYIYKGENQVPKGLPQ